MNYELTDILHPDSIKANLGTARVGSDVVVFTSTASTNDIAWRYAGRMENDGLVIFAEEQTAGRGRGGNKWFAQKGQSILCSILLLGEKASAEILTLASAVAVAQVIGKCGRGHAKIKWPNDILLNDKKIAGILLESKQAGNAKNFVLGIGINVHQNQPDFGPELAQSATSIDIESGACNGRTLLAKRLLISLDEWIERACTDEAAVIEKWSSLNTQLNQRITFKYNNQQYVGHVTGIDPQQGLIVRLDTGAVRMFDAAQTTMVRM